MSFERIYRSRNYTVLRKILNEKYNETLTDKIFTDAEIELNFIKDRFKNITLDEELHTHKYIFPRIAVYKSMQMNGISREEAYKILEEQMSINIMAAREKISKVIALPGGRRVFIRLFRRGFERYFDRRHGFSAVSYNEGKDSVRFDIVKCPYSYYTERCGCSEIALLSCRSDIMLYRGLRGIEFARKGTIAQGEEKCDFLIKLEK